MDRYGVPEYIWYPIMKHESGGNPQAHNPKGENSRGLFQINLKAHPQWKNVDLFDPATNAEYAAKYFIAPAWNTVKLKSEDPIEQTSYVWRYGIRPKWTDAKAAGIAATTKQFLEGKGIDIPQGSGGSSSSPIKDKIKEWIPAPFEGKVDEAGDWLADVGVSVAIGLVGIILLILTLKSLFLESIIPKGGTS